MNPWTNLIFGYFCLLYSFVAVAVYIFKPQYFSKLGHFQNIYGKIPGTILHVTFYCLVPMSLGVLLLLRR